MTAQTILPANTLSSGGFDVTNSLKFNSGSSDYLVRTMDDDPTLATKATMSYWFKRTKLGAWGAMGGYNASSGAGNNNFQIGFNDANYGYFWSNSPAYYFYTSALQRDPAAWKHVVVSVDTTQGTAANRVKYYENGVQVTSFVTANYPGEDDALNITRNGNLFSIGRFTNTGGTQFYYDGYLTEVALIDGLALAPTDFGEFDSSSGIWKPVDISGLTFGNNGFRLQFKGSGTSANSSGLGADTSGNDHHFTVNNLTAVDQSTDTCTNNFATLNVLDSFSSGAAFTEGNTIVTSTNSGRGIITSTFGLTSGKWYWEVKNSASGGTHASDEWNHIGIANRPAANGDNILAESGTGSNKVYEYTYYAYDGNHWNNGDQGGYGASFTTNDIIGVFLDLDNNKIYWSKNGAWADGSGNSDENDPNGFKAVTDPASTPSGFYFPACGDGGVNVFKTWQWNFGGTPGFAISSGNSDPNGYGNFEYPTEGGYAICSKNLAEYGG